MTQSGYCYGGGFASLYGFIPGLVSERIGSSFFVSVVCGYIIDNGWMTMALPNDDNDMIHE